MRRTPGQVRGSQGGSAGAEQRGRRRGRAPVLVPLLVAGALLTACSGGSSEAGAPPADAKDKQLAFAECMRGNGLEKFPDPDESGLLIREDTGIDPKSAEFRKAEEACKDLAPQGEQGPEGGKPIDAAKGRAWAKCVRDHGMPDFPDPDGDTGQVDMTGVGTGGEDPTLDKALETCQDKRPAGLTMRQNGAGR